ASDGTYGKWSRRAAGPMLYPVGTVDGDTLCVHPALRSAVRYARHNLLDPPPIPAGGFDVVLCRNVFVYLHPEAARRVARHLRDALADGGLLIVGTFGAIDDPALAPIGPRELGAYVRLPAGAAPVVVAVPAPAPPAAEPHAGLVKVHLAAIHLIEARRFGEAEALLGTLGGGGGYVPALLELALLAERRGQPARAAELATRVLELLAGRDPDDDVTGPEPLPVQYYTTSASTFLARLRGRA
ncbi:MAG TPA: CheR family methyltransferase, partial [Kofleriaceae bacterium]|nr:CheR family methyltransferase [Kofleriaceae bacterium]